MTNLTLTKTHLNAGHWEGVLTGPADATPVLALRNNDEIVQGIEPIASTDGTWDVRVAVPLDRLGDDVQTFVIVDEDSNTILASFAVWAGGALDGDLRAEMALMRAELDLLKRAFRKHCIDTA